MRPEGTAPLPLWKGGLLPRATVVLQGDGGLVWACWGAGTPTLTLAAPGAGAPSVLGCKPCALAVAPNNSAGLPGPGPPRAGRGTCGVCTVAPPILRLPHASTGTELKSPLTTGHPWRLVCGGARCLHRQPHSPAHRPPGAPRPGLHVLTVPCTSGCRAGDEACLSLRVTQRRSGEEFQRPGAQKHE